MELNQDPHYDLIIIGGGINGASVARDAVLRGLSVCLIEKNSFGSGTSSRSTKLAHGGIRYLEHFEFTLVYESLRERHLLLQNAPKYVKPLKFLYPIYKSGHRSLLRVRCGMWLYSLLSRNSTLPKHKRLKKEDILSLCPSLSPYGLQGGIIYYDAQMKDYELVLANINDASNHGLISHENTTVTNFIKDNKQCTGVIIKSGDLSKKIYGSTILNATGPWCNELSKLDEPSAKPLVAPTKGAHIIVNDLGLSHALTLEIPNEKRMFFMIPWENNTLIGTTDTPFEGNPDTISITNDDKQYLLNAANHYLKNQTLTENDIIDSFVGLRPLQYSEKTASRRSRDFSLFESNSGLLHLFGGKYTSYRHMAEITVNHIISQHPNPTQFYPCTTQSRMLQ
tara:strand:- start:893 stop:2077 length:1185 start_codon:yes stop_codon:yes gene_type:complete